MFDAILLASYGGPESLEEIDPFLDNILAGKRVPQARRTTIVERYKQFNGKSPLPQECRNFLTALRRELEQIRRDLRLYWGNLYAKPTLTDALKQMERDGVRNALVFATSILGSPQSCQRYRTATLNAFKETSSQFQKACALTFVPPAFDLPSIRRTVADDILTALAWDELENEAFFNETTLQTSPQKLILFSAHSIPSEDGIRSHYREQLLRVSTNVIRSILKAPGFGGALNRTLDQNDESLNGFPNKIILPWESVASENATDSTPYYVDSEQESQMQIPPDLRTQLKKFSLDAALVFQSRSGAPSTPWLEPSITHYIQQYKTDHPQLKSVVVSPLGFFFENMETVYDLDVETAKLCEELNITYRRVPCVGASERIVKTITQLARLSKEDYPICRCATGFCDLSCRL